MGELSISKSIRLDQIFFGIKSWLYLYFIFDDHFYQYFHLKLINNLIIICVRLISLLNCLIFFYNVYKLIVSFDLFRFKKMKNKKLDLLEIERIKKIKEILKVILLIVIILQLSFFGGININNNVPYRIIHKESSR